VPTTREAPADLVRSLRALDPKLELVYLGWGKWILGRVNPSDESIRIARELLAQYWTLSARARHTIRSIRRYRFGVACLQGFRPIGEYAPNHPDGAEYRLVDPDGRIARHFERSRWLLEHATDETIEESFFAEQDAKLAESKKEMGDEYRAKQVLDYGLKDTFSYNPRYKGEAARDWDNTRSGWKRHSTKPLVA
jgi:hypothetical protein